MKNKISLKVGVAVLLSTIIVLWGYRYYLVKELRGVVISEFKDSSSVEFKNERVFSDWTLKNSSMCGEFYLKDGSENNKNIYKFVATPSYAYTEVSGVGKWARDTTKCDDEYPESERLYNRWWHIKW